MTKLIILGTANAIPDEKHENTHMAVVGEKRFVLVDCVSNPLVRLQQAGLDMLTVTDLILTHFHPDHLAGVPSLLMQSWLLERRQPLHVYGLAHTLNRIKKIMQLYDWESWPNFFPTTFHRLPEQEMAPVLEDDELHIYASPVHHLIPTIGLRVEFAQSGKALAYSCDTQPCEEVVGLARQTDVLIHEATGAMLGHSSAAQAGEIATRAEAKELLLIHYRTGDFDTRVLIEQARQTFKGPVSLAYDFMSIQF